MRYVLQIIAKKSTLSDKHTQKHWQWLLNKYEHRMRYQRSYIRANIVLKIVVKKGHNSKNITFRVYAHCLATAPLHDVQVFQVLHDDGNDDNDLAITIVRLFL